MAANPFEQVAFYRVVGRIASQTSSLSAQMPILEFFSRPSPSTRETILLADVLGGGHECMAIVEKFLDLEGPMVLQDLPKVVENASVGERIEKMGNDFFTGQQIKGTY
jgi:hypothetical protein